MSDDNDWAEMAVGSREALSLLGYSIPDQCLPDEPAPCGGSFAQHAVAHLATLRAVVEHHIAHLGPEWAEMIEEIRHSVTMEVLHR